MLRKLSKKRKASGEKRLHNSTFARKKKAKGAKPSIADLQAKGLVKKASTLSPKGKGERSMARDAADASFSRWVRLKAADPDGFLCCFICGTRLHWTEAVLMHCEPRECMSTRYDEINCQAGCCDCNGKPLGDRANFRTMLDTCFGAGTAEKNEIKSKRTELMGAQYLRFLADTYEERIAWIRKHEPSKFHDR